MLTINGILTFMSLINFMLSCVEHEKFYNLGACCLGGSKYKWLAKSQIFQFGLALLQENEKIIDSFF